MLKLENTGDDIRDCHPLFNCFYACPREECDWAKWHKYNLTKGMPVEDIQSKGE